MRGVVAVALLVLLGACEAPPQPVASPPPAPREEADGEADATSASAPAEPPAKPEPVAQASPAPTEAPATPEAPKSTVWSKVDLVGSSVEMPEPFKLQSAPDDSDYPGAKFVYSNLKSASFIAGEGKFNFDRALLVSRLLEDPIQHSLPMTTKQTRIKGNAFEDRRVVINHMNGMITIARIWIWPSRGKQLGRFAFRSATLKSKDADSLRAPQFLDDLGPAPAGERQRGRGLTEISELRRYRAKRTFTLASKTRPLRPTWPRLTTTDYPRRGPIARCTDGPPGPSR